MRVVFVASYDPSKVLYPTDGSFDFPAALIPSQLSPVLRGRLRAILAMGTDELRSGALQPFTQGIAVCGFVVNQAIDSTTQDALTEERFNQRHFGGTGTRDYRRQRQTVTVGEHHCLGALAAFGLANAFTPFFADENVPSAMDSSRLILPRRSSIRRSLPHALSQTPASVQAFNRRQHVAGEGKCPGRSFHRAPLRRIQIIPSTHGRDATWGRPPLGPTGFSGNKSEMRFHCSSLSSNSGSILDPVDDSTASRDRLAMSDLLSPSLITTRIRRRFS